ALIAVLLVLAIICGSLAVFVNFYLSKMNFGDSKGNVNPTLEVEETINFDGQKKADADIKVNLDDTKIWYDSRILNFLLVGVDYGDEETKMFDGMVLPRSDSMILISINTIKNTINMVSLSRAAYVAIPGHGNKRLNTAHAFGGSELLAETIKQNYKIRIDKYITVDIDGFTKIIDALGGVNVNLTAEEARNVVGKNASGSYLLDGEEATAYSRLRYIDSDRKRTGRQRAVLNAIANKYRHSSVQTMVGMLDIFLPIVTTNFKKSQLLMQAVKAPSYLTMPVHEDIIPHKPVSLTPRDGKEVLIINWAESNKYLHDLLYPDMVPESLK
ncbi:MAG: LCP family protein, partial [Ruminococcus sp.]|nr:LCP family protein [Candidatus Copronaster equi]